jgi:catechol 2,3-dioxygenase-like lactoylglutathione lyase family enzyme
MTFLTACLLAPVLAGAQSTPSTDAPPIAVTGSFFALSVANLDASTRWYADKLGLKVIMRPPKQNSSAVAVLEGGGLIVELIQDDNAVSVAQALGGPKPSHLVHGISKVGVIVDDFDGTLATLRARGVEVFLGPFPARNGQRANVIVKDNAGNLIQLFGKAPPSGR